MELLALDSVNRIEVGDLMVDWNCLPKEEGVEGRILDGDVLGRGMFGGAGGWYGGADKVGEVYMFVALQVIFDILTG
mgnify:CR=1 FL=1